MGWIGIYQVKIRLELTLQIIRPALAIRWYGYAPICDGVYLTYFPQYAGWGIFGFWEAQGNVIWHSSNCLLTRSPIPKADSLCILELACALGYRYSVVSMYFTPLEDASYSAVSWIRTSREHDMTVSLQLTVCSADFDCVCDQHWRSHEVCENPSSMSSDFWHVWSICAVACLCTVRFVICIIFPLETYDWSCISMQFRLQLWSIKHLIC